MSFIKFEKAKPNTKTEGANPAAISVAVTERKFKVTTGHILTITIGHEIMKEAGLKLSDRVHLFFGSDEDKGSAMITKVTREELAKKASAGIVIAAIGKHAEGATVNGTVSTSIKAEGPLADFSGNPIARVVVDHTLISNKGHFDLVFKLPEGFFIPSEEHSKKHAKK